MVPIASPDSAYVRSSLADEQAWSAVCNLLLYPTFREMTVDRGVVGSDGYSAGGAGGNDSITLVVVVR